MSEELYYDTNINDIQTALELRERGLSLDQSALESIGIYPYALDTPDIDPRLYCIEPTEPLFNPVTRTYHQQYEISEKPDFSARKLAAVQADGRAAFAVAVAVLDARRTGPAAATVEALALGQMPDPEDLDTLCRLNALATENRARLAALEAATTLEEAVGIEPLTELADVPDSSESTPEGEA